MTLREQTHRLTDRYRDRNRPTDRLTDRHRIEGRLIDVERNRQTYRQMHSDSNTDVDTNSQMRRL